MTSVFTRIYERLLQEYGPQHWWPADTPFEVMVGAVLTQAASWSNVERAIANLREASLLSPAALRRVPQEELAILLRPSGYFNAKARKLKALVDYLGDRFDDDLGRMSEQDVASLREDLLSVHGIGEETADDIILYAVGRPSFVIDAYTRKVFSRLGLSPEKGSYATYQRLFEDALPRDPVLYGEYHALIVRHGKYVCKKRPLCQDCCLREVCPTGERILAGGECPG